MRQLTTWTMDQGKGVDDYLVAGPDPKAALANLIKVAPDFLDTIDPNPVDTLAVESELTKVGLPTLFREQLMVKLAKRLGVRTETLRSLTVKQEVSAAAVSFDKDAEPWPERVDGSELLHEISGLVSKHAILSSDALVSFCLWTALTYLADEVFTLPILAIRSPDKRCGKTRLMTLLSYLVRRPLATSNISPAALYRCIEEFSPALLIDEADAVFGHKPNDRSEELRGILNSGHNRDLAFVIRANRESGKIERFSTWAPKAIALIGQLPDTLADRSVTIDMERRAQVKEAILPLRKTPKGAWEAIRRRLMRWAGDNREKIRKTWPEVPLNLNDRAADNWLSLLAIAEAAGEDWPRLAGDVINRLSKDEDSDSLQTRLLQEIRTAFAQAGFDEPEDFFPSEELVKVLNQDLEAPWIEWRKGLGLSVEKLASTLRGFHIKSIQRQTDNERKRGYLLKHFSDAFNRYL